MHSLLWHYLGSFFLYTMLSIGAIYATYVWLRKNPQGMNALMQLSQPGMPCMPKGQKKKLAIETILPLEPRKSLYIIRADHERFLVATSMEGTQFLARLENPAPEEAAQPPAETVQQTPASISIMKYLQKSVQRTSAE